MLCFPRRAILLSLLVVPTLSGCVKKSTHRTALDALERSRAENRSLQAEMEGRIAELRREIEAGQARERQLGEEIAELRADSAALDQRRAEMVSRFDEVRTELDRVEVMLNQRGAEYRQLQQRLERLGAVEREVRERNRIYEEVIGKFRSLIDAGRLSVAIDRGRMVIQLPQDILFESGSATVGRDGRQTLAEVASVLADLPERRFQVEGHTDDVPIATERFPSNWELSTARALSVVRLLVQGGVAPGSLSGAGFGEFQPVASNADPAGRRRNRRIEIVMLPNLDLIAGEGLPGGT